MTKFKCLNLAIEQYRAIKDLKLKGEERSQIERAALSVPLNLSEGNGKFTLKDKRKFFNIAYASQKEVQTMLLILDNRKLSYKAESLAKMLYVLQKRVRIS